jgi:hypothetical protein
MPPASMSRATESLSEMRVVFSEGFSGAGECGDSMNSKSSGS